MTLPTPPPDKQAPSLTFNWKDWEPYLDNQDIPEDQKRQLIETLWEIVVAFVDLGFDLNPHQHAGQQSCGQSLDLKTLLEQAVLESDNPEQQSLPHKPKHKEPTL